MNRTILLVLAPCLALMAVPALASDSIAGLRFRFGEGLVIERSGSNITVSGDSGHMQYEITPRGMNLRDYEHLNFLGDKEQFPLAIVWSKEDCSLYFFHAADVDLRGIAARSSLRVPLSGERPIFTNLASMTFGGAKIIITKDMKILLDGQEILPLTAVKKQHAGKKSKNFSRPKS